MDHNHKIKVGLGRSRGGNYSTNNMNNQENIREEDNNMDLRRGPWTVEEDFTLINFIAHHGEGRWNSLARCAGLKRTGKSCRLRWLNYLRPDVRRGNITLEEQFLILELHSRWGNRWSKIAQHLPGRTDNEIKNYWRTRVQKHAKQLKCDVNSKEFKDTMKYLWMPRLVERIQAAAACGMTAATSTTTTNTFTQNQAIQQPLLNMSHMSKFVPIQLAEKTNRFNNSSMTVTLENSSATASSDNSIGTQVSPASDLTDCCYNFSISQSNNQGYSQFNQNYGESFISPTSYFVQAVDKQNSQWMDNGDVSDNSWNIEDMWFLQQQLDNNL